MKYVIRRSTFEYITVEADDEEEAYTEAAEADGWEWSYTPGDEEYEIIDKHS